VHVADEATGGVDGVQQDPRTDHFGTGIGDIVADRKVVGDDLARVKVGALRPEGLQNELFQRLLGALIPDALDDVAGYAETCV
jgi:hypothetical protein